MLTHISMVTRNGAGKLLTGHGMNYLFTRRCLFERVVLCVCLRLQRPAVHRVLKYWTEVKVLITVTSVASVTNKVSSVARWFSR